MTDTDTDADTTATLAAGYYDAWREEDFEALRGLLADDATFRGPLGAADSAEECVAGLRGMASMMTDLVVHRRLVEGADAITWFDLHTTAAPPATTASWIHVAHGRIASVRAVFDPREILSGG